MSESKIFFIIHQSEVKEQVYPTTKMMTRFVGVLFHSSTKILDAQNGQI